MTRSADDNGPNSTHVRPPCLSVVTANLPLEVLCIAHDIRHLVPCQGLPLVGTPLGPAAGGRGCPCGAPSCRGRRAARADPAANARPGRPRERDHAGRPRACARLSRRPRRVTIGCSAGGAGGRRMTCQNQPDLGGKTGDGRPHSGRHGSCATDPRPGYPREVRGGADHWQAQGGRFTSRTFVDRGETAARSRPAGSSCRGVSGSAAGFVPGG
jgi:hypothetical protein